MLRTGGGDVADGAVGKGYPIPRGRTWVIQVFFGARHVARLVSGKGRTLVNRVFV